MASLVDQEQRHIYLTDDRCNATDEIIREQLHKLELEYGWWDGRRVIPAHGLEDTPKDCEFYPLTPEEAAFLSTQGFVTGEGCVGYTSYATLFQGKKWLTPTVEVKWPENAENKDKALNQANELINRWRRRICLKKQNPILYDSTIELIIVEKNRYIVPIHIPMEWALKNLTSRNGFTFDHYCGFLTGLMI